MFLYDLKVLIKQKYNYTKYTKKYEYTKILYKRLYEYMRKYFKYTYTNTLLEIVEKISTLYRLYRTSISRSVAWVRWWGAYAAISSQN